MPYLCHQVKLRNVVMKMRLGHLVLRVSKVHQVCLTGVTNDISEKHVLSGLLSSLSDMFIVLTFLKVEVKSKETYLTIALQHFNSYTEWTHSYYWKGAYSSY